MHYVGHGLIIDTIFLYGTASVHTYPFQREEWQINDNGDQRHSQTAGSAQCEWEPESLFAVGSYHEGDEAENSADNREQYRDNLCVESAQVALKAFHTAVIVLVEQIDGCVDGDTTQ